MISSGKGLRFNAGKTKMSLVSPDFVEELAKVLTFGSVKYDSWNYMKGLKFSEIIDSLDRHILAIKKGEWQDKESLLTHIGHATCNLQFLYDGAKYFPEMDDLLVNKLIQKKVGLDVDEVLGDFCGGWINRHGGERPNAWSFDRLILPRLQECACDSEFWLSLDPIFPAEDLKFEPTAYISHRMCDVSMTEDWLDKNGFPVAQVIHVKNTAEKIGVCKELGIEVFLEDNYNTFKLFQSEGMVCYLFDRNHNRRFSVGHWRIKDIKDLPIFKYDVK